MKRGSLALWPWLIASALAVSETAGILKDIHTVGRGYKNIHHRSQKKVRRITRQRG